MNGDACPTIHAEHLTRIFKRGAEEIRAVNDISLTVEPANFVAFVGPSGSGKTTLINILGCLDNPTSGLLELCGQKIFDAGVTLSEGKLTDIRRDLFGYVFQKFYLIPTLTVRENVMLPFVFFKKPGAEAEVDKVIGLMGLEKRTKHLPGRSRGARCSAWRSRAPSSTSRGSCWPTSRRETSTWRGARRSATS